MTEPTVGPMTTDLTPVTQATAPLVDAPPPVAPEAPAPVTQDDEAPSQRGRVASPRTVMIRAMLDDTDGGLTFSTALPLLQKAGFDVNENTFNVTKSAWKKAKRPDTMRQITPKVEAKPVKKAKPKVKVQKGKVELPEVTVQEAFAFVQNAGGLAKAEASVLHSRACLKAFKALVAQTAKLAA